MKDLPVVDPTTGLVDPDEVPNANTAALEAFHAAMQDRQPYDVAVRLALRAAEPILAAGWWAELQPQLNDLRTDLAAMAEKLRQAEAERDEAQRLVELSASRGDEAEGESSLLLDEVRDAHLERDKWRRLYEQTLHVADVMTAQSNDARARLAAYERLVTAARAWLARWTPAGVRHMKPGSANADLVAAIQALPREAPASPPQAA